MERFARGVVPVLLTAMCGCAPAPAPEQRPSPLVEDVRYKQAEERVRRMNREAEKYLDAGHLAKASAAINDAEPYARILLAPTRPPLAAVEAVSDFDHLYGRSFLVSRNYVWARMMFQKNYARWKNWQPQTEETARRLAQAKAAIAECDRLMRQ